MPPRRTFGPEPVETYERARGWLFQFSRVEEWAFEAEPVLPLEARLVCDVFWISEQQLVRDLRADWKNALGPERPVRLHWKLSHGWGL